MDGIIYRSLKILKILFFANLVVIPVSISNYTMIQQDALKIHFSKNSPPLAIIEDEQNKTVQENTPDLNFSAHENSGKLLHATSRLVAKKSLQKFIDVAEEFSQEQKVAEKEELSTESYEVRDLGGLTLDKNSVNIRLLKKEMGIYAPTPKVQIATITKKIESPKVEETPAEVLDLPKSETLEERAERTIAGINVDSEMSADSFQGDDISSETQPEQPVRTQPLTAEQVAANFAHNALIQPVIAITPPLQFHYVQRNPHKTNPTSAPVADSSPTRPASPSMLTPPTSSSYAMRGLSGAKKQDLLSHPPSQAMMGGSIEFADGLAFTGQQKITVYRQVAGNKTSDGQVILDQAKFEIYVDDPSTGMIAADMYDDQQIVGHGEILLADALKNANATGELRNLHMILRPTVNAIQNHIASAYAAQSKKDLEATTTINDVLTDKEKLLPSIVMNKISKPNFWGSLTLGTSMQLFRNILYPDKNIDALKEILGVTGSKKEIGIIRGVVKIMGTPVAGAQVEVVPSQLQSNQTQKAIYFNSFIPDQNLAATTSNGEYAFVGVSEGTYVLRATYNGKILSPQVVPVENGFVTEADFNVSKPSMAEAYIFSLHNSEMVSANIGFLGSDHFSLANGKKLLSFSGSDGIQFLEARSQSDNFFTTRVAVDKSEKEILMPMVSQSWLTRITSKLKLDSAPDSAIIIGTAPEVAYQIELDPNAYNDETKIIYFGKNGYATEGATAVPPGGGFIALNVNPGLRSLFVTYQGSQAKKVVTMAADGSAISVFASKY